MTKKTKNPQIAEEKTEESKEELKSKKEIEIEINNLTEEMKQILEPCIKCGMCKSNCPVFAVLKEEIYSPRGKAILLSEDILDKIVFQCTLCKACEKKCPLNIKVSEAVLIAREILNLKAKELPGNKEMMRNIRQTGNPFGDFSEKSKLYCC